jgi:Secretory lipase
MSPLVRFFLIASGLLSPLLAFPSDPWAGLDLGREVPHVVVPRNSASASAAVLPPSEDPWYTAPNCYKHAPPGKVLRIRVAPGNLTELAGPNCSAVYNILYRTTNSLYKPSWAVTTLFVPTSPVQSLLSYQVPYDSPYINAGPSYAMYSSLSPITVYVDVIFALAKGYFVSVPDYEGPLAAFTAGVNSGHATIDSVRAVLADGHRYGLNRTKAKYALSGYSGGALASEWAAELQVQYAPEMTFAGAALGGLTPNVTSVLEIANKGYAAGLIPVSETLTTILALYISVSVVDFLTWTQNGILGLTAQFPDARAFVVSQLKKTGPYNATGFLAALNYTVADSFTAFAGQDMAQYFVNGFSPVFNNSLTSKLVNSDGLMGFHGVPQMPIFAYKAVADLQSPIADTDALVAKYCTVGANILYQRNSIGGHSSEFINGHEAAAEWLDSVLARTYTQKFPTMGCTVQNVAINITSSPF